MKMKINNAKGKIDKYKIMTMIKLSAKTVFMH